MSPTVPRMEDSQAQRFRDKLLALPRELRDLIYDYAWHGTHLYYQDLDCAVHARYFDTDGDCDETWGLPSWTTIHPHIREEAFELFHRNADFSVGDGNEYTIPKYGDEWALEQNVLLITKARHVTIFGLSGSYVWDPRMTGSSNVHGTLANMTATADIAPAVLSIDLSDIQQALICRMAGQSKARTMRLAIRWQHTFDSSPEVYQGHGLEKLGRLCTNVPVVDAYCMLNPVSLSLGWFLKPLEEDCVFKSDIGTFAGLIFENYSPKQRKVGGMKHLTSAQPVWHCLIGKQAFLGQSLKHISSLTSYGAGAAEREEVNYRYETEEKNIACARPLSKTTSKFWHLLKGLMRGRLLRVNRVIKLSHICCSFPQA
jgi:hypothetical protein